MATDFYPDRPIPFDRFLPAVSAEPRLMVLHEIGSDRAEIERPRGNFVHAHRLTDGNTAVSRYGDADPEPVLLVLDALFGVRFGPEHERADDRPICENTGLHKDSCTCPDCYAPDY